MQRNLDDAVLPQNADRWLLYCFETLMFKMLTCGNAAVGDKSRTVADKM